MLREERAEDCRATEKDVYCGTTLTRNPGLISPSTANNVSTTLLPFKGDRTSVLPSSEQHFSLLSPSTTTHHSPHSSHSSLAHALRMLVNSSYSYTS